MSVIENTAKAAFVKNAGNVSVTPSHGFARLELLAPARDWECARAAVENGADAIYFGLDKFNARMRAQNFTLKDLPELMSFLHRRGVKGFLTFNILVFEDELAEAQAYLREIIAAGVDAAIVQDAGICRLIRGLSPDFPIHASTQMTISSGGGLEYARDLGCSLVALARECSIEEIKAMRAATPAATSPMPLEVFIHGALCVAYSGQCLTSEALGGRSANRGVCAQACRLPYTLVSDGQHVELGDKRYLLSPKDLVGMSALPDLIRAGVTVFKIEGRLKNPEYVAGITRLYRKAIDEVMAVLENDKNRGGEDAATRVAEANAKASRYEMEMAFSRGLHTGWLRGVNNRELVHARFPKKRGVYLGTVKRVVAEAAIVELEAPLKLGDGVVFDAGHPEAPEQGGRVYGLFERDNETRITFGRGDVDWSRVHPGDLLWKTSDPALERALKQTYTNEKPGHPRPVDIEVRGRAGEPLTLRAKTETGCAAEAVSQQPLMAAQKQPLTIERLRDQLGRLGGTPFILRQLEDRLEGNVILPVSELNRLRRQFAAELEEKLARPHVWTLNPPGIADEAPNVASVSAFPGSENGPAELVPLARSLEQLEALLGCGCQRIYCELEDPKRYRDAAVLAGCSGNCMAGRPELFVAPPRIFKPGEEWMLKQIRSCGADGWLSRNYEHLRYFAGERCVGDFSFNLANHIGAEFFLEKYGLERVTASFDLDGPQLEALARRMPPGRLEVSIHHHMPMFHMEHCVFCAFLSQGTDYTNCGRPCEKHEVRLRDRVGAEHPLKADAGCRNTVFHARAQTGAQYMRGLASLGVRWFRIEFLNETPEQAVQIIARYRALIRGDLTATQLVQDLRLMNRLGVGCGPE
jgi:putative protease